MVSEDPSEDEDDQSRGMCSWWAGSAGQGCAADGLWFAWVGICSGNWIRWRRNIGVVPVRSVELLEVSIRSGSFLLVGAGLHFWLAMSFWVDET